MSSLIGFAAIWLAMCLAVCLLSALGLDPERLFKRLDRAALVGGGVCLVALTVITLGRKWSESSNAIDSPAAAVANLDEDDPRPDDTQAHPNSAVDSAAVGDQSVVSHERAELVSLITNMEEDNAIDREVVRTKRAAGEQDFIRVAAIARRESLLAKARQRLHELRNKSR